MAEPVSWNDGYDDWLDAIADDDGYYLECPRGHGSLPPRRVCPRCGDTVETRSLPASGVIDTYTIVHVSTPSLSPDTPYVTAVATFEPVRLTGFLRIDPADATVGITVEATVGQTTRGDRAVFLKPL